MCMGDMKRTNVMPLLGMPVYVGRFEKKMYEAAYISIFHKLMIKGHPLNQLETFYTELPVSMPTKQCNSSH